MVGTSSTSSSCASLSSLDGISPKSNESPTIKFLCSYGGKILPRHQDGKLRYVGGHNRVLTHDRSSDFSELQAKLRELCGWECPFSIRCQLPGDDLDALISITSDEDLANLMEEYYKASRDKLPPLKIRAFLLTQPAKPATPESPQAMMTKKSFCNHQMFVQAKCGKPANRCNCYHHNLQYHEHASTSKPRSYLVHHGNHW